MKPGGCFDSEEFCVALDAVCEAYPFGGTPSQRLGWDVEGDPSLLTFALAFDMAVRRKAQSWKAKFFDESASASANPIREAMKGQYDNWKATAGPEALAALAEMIGG